MSDKHSWTYRAPEWPSHDPDAAGCDPERRLPVRKRLRPAPYRASLAEGRIAGSGLLIHHGPVARSLLEDAGETLLDQLLEAHVESPAVRHIAEGPACVVACERIGEERECLANVPVHLRSATPGRRL